MDLEDLQETYEALEKVVRATVRSEFTSIWLPIQLVSIAAAILIAVGIATLVRRRFDLVSATMGLPAYLRLAARAVIANFGMLMFVVVATIIRASIDASVPKPRTYLIAIVVHLASAWVLINI